MGESTQHECGVAAVYLKKPENSILLPRDLINCNLIQQHRGQKSTGISVLGVEGGPFKTFTGVGRVNEVFRIKDSSNLDKILQEHVGFAGIGHTRYSTSGGDRDDKYSANSGLQPIVLEHNRIWKRFSLAWNGNLTNSDQLMEEMRSRYDYSFSERLDTKTLVASLALTIKQLSRERDVKSDIFSVVDDLMNKLKGAYNVVTLFGDGDLVAFRDPLGFHPLVFGENEDKYAIASESSTLRKIGLKNIREVMPGEAILINEKGVSSKRLRNSQNQSFCHFEDVYFQRADSESGGQSVRELRRNLGVQLAKREKLNLDISHLVVPVPKTAIPSAEAYAKELGLELRSAIEKLDSDRGFINGLKERRRITDGNYNIFESDIRGRKLILVDDSIVRGDVSKIIVKRIRDAGAAEVHLRVTDMPIKHPCFYGIDFPSKEELLFSRFGNLQEITKYLGVDSLEYQTLEGLLTALGRGVNELCLACLTGEYPTKI